VLYQHARASQLRAQASPAAPRGAAAAAQPAALGLSHGQPHAEVCGLGARHQPPGAPGAAPRCAAPRHYSAAPAAHRPAAAAAAQNLIEYITRQKIYDSVYWKQECFGLAAEDVVDRAAALRAAGGMAGEPRKPAPFLCLALKLLQVQPAREVVLELLRDPEFKYIRLLAAFYLRLTARPTEAHRLLEPLLADYRRVRVQAAAGGFELRRVDEVVDELLRSDHAFGVALPHLPARRALEAAGALEPRASPLAEEDAAAAAAEEEAAARAAAEARATQEVARAANGGERSGRTMEEGERREDALRGDERRPREKWRLGRDERRRGRSRSRSRDRARHRDSRSPSRDRRHSRSPGRRGRRRDDSPGRRRRSRSDERGRKRTRDASDAGRGAPRREGAALEIAEANRLRASLGLAPLR
jgi:pre-mRNA-splicing factor 38A